MSYLMESPAEAARLGAQAKVTPLATRLTSAGLVPGMRVLDAGCGPGAEAADVLSVVGSQGSMVGIDASPARIEEARRAVTDPRVRFEVASLPRTGLDGESFDFTFSQFVFEYLADPEAALGELVRVTRPGGRVAVIDVDRLGLDYWPRSVATEQGQLLFLEAVRAHHFDGEMGRKLFALFRRAGLAEIRVDASMQYLVAGAADARLLADWETRFAVLAPVVAPRFGSREAYQDFCRAYLGMLADPDTLKYLLVLTTSGMRR